LAKYKVLEYNYDRIDEGECKNTFEVEADLFLIGNHGELIFLKEDPSRAVMALNEWVSVEEIEAPTQSGEVVWAEPVIEPVAE
jgi:hypothetical protein